MKRVSTELTTEYRKQQKVLNDSYLSHLKSVSSNAQSMLHANAARDYLFYTSQLSTQLSYDVSGSQVFSCGTGDCGQLGHGGVSFSISTCQLICIDSE